MKNAFPKLILTIVFLFLFAFFSINFLYVKQQLTHPVKGVKKKIADTQDKIKSLNTELSKWINEYNMTLEAKKLNLRKSAEGEVVILENETDS